MSSNVLRIDISEAGETLGSSVFDKRLQSKKTETVVIPQSKKKRRLSGENRLTLPENTQTVKVRVTHTHRHTFSSSNEEDTLERDGNKLISVAQRIKTEKENSILGNNSADVLKALDDLSSQISKTQDSKPPIINDDDDDDNDATGLKDHRLEYGHEPLFPTFSEDPLFDALNNRLPIEQVADEELAFQNFMQHCNEIAKPGRSSMLNNTPLKFFRINKKGLLVDLDDISRRSFEPVATLQAKSDFMEAREFVKVDASKRPESDTFLVHFDRMRSSMDEQNSVWARAYKELQRSGNAARSETSRLSLSEKTELFVRCSDFRKHYFLPQPSSASCQKICGNYGLLTLLETPNIFVLPNSGMFCLAMQQRFGRTSDGSYGEFVDFERCRLRLMATGPFTTDPGWLLWTSCGSKIASCAESTLHNEIVQRDYTLSGGPNVRFYDAVIHGFSNNCICEKNGTVVLCGNAKHMDHVVNQACQPVAGTRIGSDNMCIVACDVFGSATRERWMVLRMICGTMPAGRHDELVVNTFLSALKEDKHLSLLLPCLREFGVENQTLLHTGKKHDEKVVDRIGSRVRVQNNLPSDSHGRERFYLYDPMEMTLALLLFVEARMTAGWFNVWRVWVACVQTHCFCCPFCSGPISESLHRFVVYNSMLPILPVTMATLIEQFALVVRCNREMYR